MRPSLAAVTERFGQRDELYDLECALLDPSVRRSAKEVEALLHPDFIELGSSGRVYDRHMMISMMTSGVSAPVVMRDFETRSITDDTVLVTYRSIGQAGDEARRSSLWVKNGKGWQIRFHQGTRIPNSWGQIS